MEITRYRTWEGRYEHMPQFSVWPNGFFGRSPNASPAPNQSGSSTREDDNDSIAVIDTTKPNSSTGTSTSTSSSCSSSSKTLHGVIKSALWTIARTPALVDAIDRMEDRYRRTKQLSSVLRALRHPSVLTDSSRWRDATENADAYLAGSHLSLYNSMEPMDAIRGIAGLCDDAETVLKETVQATYKTLVSCSNPGCLHKEGVRWEHEEHLRCTRSTAQQTVDARATASNSNGTSFYPCKACGKKVASKVRKLACSAAPLVVLLDLLC